MVRLFDKLTTTTNGINYQPFVLNLSKGWWVKPVFFDGLVGFMPVSRVSFGVTNLGLSLPSYQSSYRFNPLPAKNLIQRFLNFDFHFY
jgi:hypothetical protein